MTQILTSFKPSKRQIIVVCLVIVYIAINVFRIWGDSFIFNLNTNIVHPLAIGTTLLAFMLSRQIKTKGKNRLLWWNLTIGWALWTIAQLWWSIEAFTRQEVPFPSWADFFWIVGYIPMYIALWERLSALPQISSSLQRLTIWISSLLTIIVSVWFVLIPIVQTNNPTAIVESILNLLYPALDLVLLILVIRIFFTYHEGRYGKAWRWLLVGFVLMSFSDLISSYAATAGLYYPNGKANLFSTIGVDVPFNISYLFWLISLTNLRTIQKGHYAFAEIDSALTLVPNTHILVFANWDNTIIDVSKNYKNVFSSNMVKGKTIQEALGISVKDSDLILKDSKENKTFKEHEFMVNTLLGQEQALVSGIAIFNPQGEYSGVYLLLRILNKDYSLDKLLSDYEKGMVNSISSKTGANQNEEEEIKQLLGKYYQAILKTLYNRVFVEGGGIMTNIFLSELQSASTQNSLRLEIQPDNLLDISALSLSEMQKALPLLLETAKQFVIGITDKSTVNIIIQEARSKFNEIELANISHFEMTKQDPI